MKQIPANIIDNLLRCLYHGLAVAIRRERSGEVDGGSKKDTKKQAGKITGNNIPIDKRLYHIGAKKVCSGADGDKNSHGSQKKLMHSHIG